MPFAPSSYLLLHDISVILSNLDHAGRLAMKCRILVMQTGNEVWHISVNDIAKTQCNLQFVFNSDFALLCPCTTFDYSELMAGEGKGLGIRLVCTQRAPSPDVVGRSAATPGSGSLTCSLKYSDGLQPTSDGPQPTK